MSPAVGMIWAQSTSGVIGAQGGMPWHVPEDLAYLKQVTSGCPVIMGRRTWTSLPERFRPLPGRTNIVITRDASCAAGLPEQGALTADSLEGGLELAEAHLYDASAVWLLGGGAVYGEAIEKDLAQIVSITQLDLEVEGDTYAPELDPALWELAATMPEQGWQTSETGVRFRFETYRRR